MSGGEGRSGWVLPTVTVLVVSALGVATNLATDLKSSWIAWLVVVLLTVFFAVVTVIGERRVSAKRQQGGSVEASTSKSSQASRIYGLQMRHTRIIRSDGTTEIVKEYFNEELARQSLGDDSPDESNFES
jgi:hypothetical protein